jgi:hypothetical protein
VLDIATLFHIRSYIHTIYNLTVTAIGSITITSPVVISIQLNNNGLHWTRLFHDPHSAATNHTIDILHVTDSLATTALGDFLIHTVTTSHTLSSVALYHRLFVTGSVLTVSFLITD